MMRINFFRTMELKQIRKIVGFVAMIFIMAISSSCEEDEILEEQSIIEMATDEEDEKKQRPGGN